MIRQVRLTENTDDVARERELLLLAPRSPHPAPETSGCSEGCRLAARVHIDGLAYEIHQRGGADLFVPLGRNSRGDLVHGPGRSSMLAALDAAL